MGKQYVYNIGAEDSVASNIFQLVDEGARVLEIGCASGVQTRFLTREKGCRVTGIELDPESAELARGECEEVIVGDIERMDLTGRLGKGEFDLVLIADVLEHLYDPAKVLREVQIYLKEGGAVVASIPNVGHASLCWELCHGRFEYRQYGLLDDTHIRFFTRRNIVKMFESAGLLVTGWNDYHREVDATEFRVDRHSEMDKEVLRWMAQKNPDSCVYQFVLRAKRRAEIEDSEEGACCRLEDLEVEEKIRNLEYRVSEATRQYEKIRSEHEWLIKHRFGPFTDIVYKILSVGK